MSACPHGMPTPRSCYECMEEGIQPDHRPDDGHVGPGPEREGPDIVARWLTQCRACNLAVHPGETICRTTHGTYEHAHHHQEQP